MSKWQSKNRHKFLLQYHLILVCKYRKKLFLSKEISDDIKELSYKICDKHNIKIKYLETDRDYIHYMIEIAPNIWNKHHKYLIKHFWKEKTFYTDGYFVSSVGNVSENTLKKYIENQG